MDKPNYIKIKNIVTETPFVKTFYFDLELKSRPGQFVMLWIPGVDQKPFSIGSDDGQTFGLSVFKRGPLTEKLFGLNTGDRVGISGPFGKPFSIKPDTHYIMVAGGYGAAPLGYLTAEVSKIGCQIDFIIGARNAENLLFQNKLSELQNLHLHITTDDGSEGHKGFVTDILPEILKVNSEKNTLVCTCGPEMMEKKVLEICNESNTDCELSIERYMKCGNGVCGQCAVDPLGICMCTDGPVVSRQIANQITEFGKYHRDKTGSKIIY